MEFLQKYNINITNEKLFESAVTHSSYSNENKDCTNYERLEFLGDAVLELVTSEYFYKHTEFKEGEMTKKRASFVCEAALNFYASKLNLIDYIKVGHGQEDNINETIVADVFEAVVGAIYLDCGFDVVQKFIYDIIAPEIQADNNFFNDYKTLLQEMVQTTKKSIEYIIVEENGVAHNKEFKTEVRIDNIIYGRGSGRNKKEAEQNAAKDAYNKSVK